MTYDPARPLSAANHPGRRSPRREKLAQDQAAMRLRIAAEHQAEADEERRITEELIAQARLDQNWAGFKRDFFNLCRKYEIGAAKDRWLALRLAGITGTQRERQFLKKATQFSGGRSLYNSMFRKKQKAAA